jgi:hypothetical protein
MRRIMGHYCEGGYVIISVRPPNWSTALDVYYQGIYEYRILDSG